MGGGRAPTCSAGNSDLPPPAGLQVFRLDADPDVVLLEWPSRFPAPPAELTAAERAVLSLVRAGLTNATIALRRGRSRNTVANQIARAFAKLGVRSRLEFYARFSDVCAGAED